MKKMSPEIKLFLLGILGAVIIIGIYGIPQLDKPQKKSVSLTADPLVFAVDTSGSVSIPAIQSPLASDSSKVIVEERATFVIAISTSNQPAFVSEQQVRQMQESSAQKQLASNGVNPNLAQ